MNDSASNGHNYFSPLEARAPMEREESLFVALRAHLKSAVANSPYWATQLKEVDIETVTDREALANLPVLSKSDLVELQDKKPLFGGIAPANSDVRRVFYSPGPIVEPQPGGTDPWRMSSALFAAGMRRGDVIANCFSYHLTPAGFMFDEAAANLGCVTFPAGVGNTDTLVEAFNHFAISGYVGTPDFLQIILEKAKSLGHDITSVKNALVSGGPLFPVMRDWYKQEGVNIKQCYGTAELGLISYETDSAENGMVIAENCIVEIVRPGTSDPVAPGEVGEVVVTTFDPNYPLIRFATGDLSAILPGQSACGRTNARLKGWMGRADQTTKVRGMFVHPRQIAKIVKSFPQMGRARLEVSENEGKDQMTFICEFPQNDDAVSEQIAQSVRSECRLRADIKIVPLDSLPNDGKVIEDRRAIGV
ncbi:phenylacetate--CoA ligase family protein [Maritalea porphyrae]|uniref:Phenylacetate--CoA ligase n=1 Tax=Maritalea porphyrae TaxID=880732 RepID=A0ABQ5UP32_9HYPH|nr:AMP-binding protein [Maritalea porphyrae]GLQ17040.1 phenylacetate--CoA ligase [Maritalea porphyrae]